MSPEYYVDVILPLPLGKLYTYKVPAGDVAKCADGIRVIVQFGKQKLYTGIVRQIHNNAPEGYRPKEILEVLDDVPVVTSNQLELWEWMASYYLCTLGDVMNAALPAAMKIQSETVVGLVPDNAPDGLILTPEEESVIQELKSGSQLTVSEVASVAGVKNPMPMIRRLIEKGVLVLSEEITEDFSRRLVDFVRLSVKAESDDAFMREIFEKLEKRAPKQLDLLMHFMRMKQDSRDLPIRKNQLLRQSGITAPVLEQLVSKGVLEVYSELESHAFASATGSEQQVELSEVQMEAYNTITDSFHGEKPVLLHGVTSSGKTEVYIRLINDAIGSGKQVLYLLPEIALTTQILGRLKSHFGEQMLVYHSRHSAKERSEVYMKVLQDGREGQLKFPLVIGARSAVFLPFLRPGLIIVDEEHDSSYKQMDPAPRYNARDVAVAVSRMWGCRALLGSATPSLESYYNAESGKYDLVRMTQRYGGMKMPAIEMVDLRDAFAKGAVKSGFSMRLRELIQSALTAGEQVILFQNRRGFAPVLECRNCGWIPQCVNCDVSLTYHKRSDQLKCHYCGYSTHVPGACKACEHTDIRMKGLGTERIEDDVQTLFPDARVQRLDLDTTTSKHSFQRILESFSSREIDILVGTQMVTKGLDFDNVSVVGVLSADHLIGFPDFRAAERSFQLLAQVAGRAGRKFRQGKVVVQAYNITHPIFRYLVSNDYPGFYRNECSERERFGYPPFTRLVELRLRHRDERQLEMLASEFAKMLRAKFGKRVLGPVPPPVARVRNFYIRQVLLKVEKGYSDKQLKTAVRDITARFLSIPDYRSLLIQADVDPM